MIFNKKCLPSDSCPVISETIGLLLLLLLLLAEAVDVGWDPVEAGGGIDIFSLWFSPWLDGKVSSIDLIESW